MSTKQLFLVTCLVKTRRKGQDDETRYSAIIEADSANQARAEFDPIAASAGATYVLEPIEKFDLKNLESFPRRLEIFCALRGFELVTTPACVSKAKDEDDGG